MAAIFTGEEYEFTGTTKVSLTTILGTDRIFLSTFVARAPSANAGNIYIGGNGLTTTAHRGGLLEPGDAVGVDTVNKFFSTDDVFLVAEQIGDHIHILWAQ